MIHSIKVKKLLGMMVKLDTGKSYNKINWQFIRSILKDFGFRIDWIDWIMNLVSSSLLSILMNGVPSGTVNLSRVIRQGDPLSPFVLILMEFFLGRSIAALRDNNDMRGLNVHPRVMKQTNN